jgi:ribosomal protein S18 acetylase RimI-like enzyme
MPFRVETGGTELLENYTRVPIAFEVKTILQVYPVNGGMGGIELIETPVEPYIKDYDAYEDGPPTEWHRQFDMTNWGVLLAWQSEQPIAGAAIAWDTPGINMLAGRDDLAVLWDIRVHPGWRRQGYGELLFDLAAQWARQRGCTEMKIETQNVNVPACHFYAHQGCLLGNIDRYGYQNVPAVSHETMLIWYYSL